MNNVRYFAKNNSDGGVNITATLESGQGKGVEVFPPYFEDKAAYIYQNAWHVKDKKIQLDLQKAKKQHLELLKKVRDNKFKELDKEQLIALGKGDQNAVDEIENIKNELRDFPNHINWDNIKNLYDLTHTFPPALLG